MSSIVHFGRRFLSFFQRSRKVIWKVTDRTKSSPSGWRGNLALLWSLQDACLCRLISLSVVWSATSSLPPAWLGAAERRTRISWCTFHCPSPSLCRQFDIQQSLCRRASLGVLYWTACSSSDYVDFVVWFCRLSHQHTPWRLVVQNVKQEVSVLGQLGLLVLVHTARCQT